MMVKYCVSTLLELHYSIVVGSWIIVRLFLSRACIARRMERASLGPLDVHVHPRRQNASEIDPERSVSETQQEKRYDSPTRYDG
jgi:hypothetical protein